MQNSTFQPESSTTHNTETLSNWFSSERGIYHSKHKPIQLPTSPFLDVVSFIFSHKHNGVSALIDSSSGFSFSYSQLQKMVKSISSGLHEIGISQGDVVLILLPNTLFLPIVFLAVLLVGAIATTMNPLSSHIEINKQMKDCNVTLVFTTSENLDKLENLGVQIIGVPMVQDINSSLPEFSFFRKIVSRDPNLAPTPLINQQDTAAILYSSGTTGVSKGVVLSHRNLISVVELFVRFEASQYENLPGSKNVYLAAIPMFHVYGLSLLIMGLLSLGSTIVVMRNFDVDEMVRAIDRYKVTHLPVVPPILMALTRVKARGGCDLGSLKQVSCGAAPLSKKTIQDFLQSLPHVDFIQGYGMTESTAVGTRGFNTEKCRKYTSVGLLAPNMQAKVVDWNTGSCLPPGNSGELWLRGPGIMKGYILANTRLNLNPRPLKSNAKLLDKPICARHLSIESYLNDANATKSTVDEEGWLHTGDIVHFDQDGYLYIFDRIKETIKYKGFQIAPADLEAILICHPEILDVAVTAHTDDEAGEVPVAFVVKRCGSALSQADVINFVALQVAPYKKVRKVLFTHSIPKSAAGKILRRQLKNSFISRM